MFPPLLPPFPWLPVTSFPKAPVTAAPLQRRGVEGVLELVPYLLRGRCLSVPSVPSVEINTGVINVQTVGVAEHYMEVVCNVAWLM